MKTIFILALIFISFAGKSQLYVGGVDVNKIDSLKVLVVNVHQNKIIEGMPCRHLIDLSFLPLRFSGFYITDIKGNQLQLNTLNAIINHLENRGWTLNSHSSLINLESTYAHVDDAASRIHHFLTFKRK